MTHFSAKILPRQNARQKCSFLLLSVPLFLSLFVPACGSRHRDVRLFLDAPFPHKLSAWRLFTGTHGGLKPNSRVLPYDLNTPLFSDYANKYRFVWMPRGTSATYRDDTTFDFPVGTILAKTFAFPRDGHPGEEKLIETRLLVNTNSGWVGLPYIWNDRQSEATLQLAPDPVAVRFTDKNAVAHDFTYQIPNVNECRQCHDRDKSLQPIGPKARNLNKDFPYPDGTANQLVRWTQVSVLRGAPSPDDAPRAPVSNDPASGSLEQRALAYLDNNCAHCHQPAGSAGYTGIDFRLNHFDPAHAGFCKHPNSAGNMGNRQYDVVPGDPEGSILIYRLASTAPKVMMPQIGRATVHAEGLALLYSWIGSLPLQSCRSM